MVQALFTDRGSNLYKPKASQDDDALGGDGGDERRFRPDKGLYPGLVLCYCLAQP